MPPYEESGPHGVLPPDGSGTWHMVESPLDPRSVCGNLVLYGARLRPWKDVPHEDRCDSCLGRAGDASRLP
ncbi:MAG: hypothetical protein WAL61_06000 [Acidimicrobiales bacterium]